MSIDMYLSEVRSQTSSAVQLANAYSQAIGAITDSCRAFMDAPLSGQTYDSAKIYFTTVYPPLVNGVTMVCEALTEAHQKFPDDFEQTVDSCDIKESELKEKIEQGKQVLQALYKAIDSLEESDPALEQSIMRTQATIAKLEEKLSQLYLFNGSSPSIFSDVESLLNQLNQGISEVGKGSAWNASSGTFELNRMSLSWIQPLNEKWKEREKALERKRPKHKDYELRSRIGEGGEVFYELYVNGVLDVEATKGYNELCAMYTREITKEFWNGLLKADDFLMKMVGAVLLVNGVTTVISGIIGITSGGIAIGLTEFGYTAIFVSPEAIAAGKEILEGFLLTGAGSIVVMSAAQGGNSSGGSSFDTLMEGSFDHAAEHLGPTTDPTKADHTIFKNLDKTGLKELLKEAWKNRGIPRFEKFRQVFEIDMGRIIGTDGETKIRIVVDILGKLVSSYPIK
ncbi:T7SS effector LXG polymorphic toxin [Enterococcus larvae]|uniref:T7SS effector LXG polymorphic toxin n=1 Tax=Enterococcus larvae TaxID=2794352 RepID=UPI003F3DC10B